MCANLVEHTRIIFANKTIKKAMVDKLSLKFPKLNLEQLKLEVHSDASYNYTVM